MAIPMSPRAPTAGEQLIDVLLERLMAVLRSLLSPGTACALLDFPLYANVGDHAIWLGQRLALQAIGARLVYVADQSTFVPEHLATRLNGGVILLQGGGTLGDLWPEHQRFREAVIAAFPDHRIIQLPQTINFQHGSALRHAKSILNLHPNLTLLVRDRQSLELASAEFKNVSLLCPDMSVALGALKRRESPAIRVLHLYRTDQESALPRRAPTVEGSGPVDWVAGPHGRPVGGMATLEWFNDHRRTLEWIWTYTPYLYDWFARQRLAYGCELLSRGRVIITDRLHGHILSVLLGIPHILLDDRYHKVRNFYENWTKDCELTIWAESAEEAVELAKVSVAT